MYQDTATVSVSAEYAGKEAEAVDNANVLVGLKVDGDLKDGQPVRLGDAVLTATFVFEEQRVAGSLDAEGDVSGQPDPLRDLDDDEQRRIRRGAADCDGGDDALPFELELLDHLAGARLVSLGNAAHEPILVGGRGFGRLDSCRVLCPGRGPAAEKGAGQNKSTDQVETRMHFRGLS